MKKTMIVFFLVLICSAWLMPSPAQAAPVVSAPSMYAQPMATVNAGMLLSNFQPTLLFVNPFKWVSDAVGGAVSNVSSFVSGAARTVGNVVTAPFKIAKNVVSVPLKLVKNIGFNIFGTGKKIISGVGNAITAPFKLASNLIGGIAKGVGGFVSGVGNSLKWVLIIGVVLLLLPVFLLLLVIIGGTCKIVGGAGKAVSAKALKTPAPAAQPQVIMVAPPQAVTTQPAVHGPIAVSFDK